MGRCEAQLEKLKHGRNALLEIPTVTVAVRAMIVAPA